MIQECAQVRRGKFDFRNIDQDDLREIFMAWNEFDSLLSFAIEFGEILPQFIFNKVIRLCINHDPESLACVESFLDKYGGKEYWKTYLKACDLLQQFAEENLSKEQYISFQPIGGDFDNLTIEFKDTCPYKIDEAELIARREELLRSAFEELMDSIKNKKVLPTNGLPFYLYDMVRSNLQAGKVVWDISQEAGIPMNYILDIIKAEK